MLRIRSKIAFYSSPVFMKKYVILIILLGLLLSCSTYHPLPLPEKTYYPKTPTTLTIQNVASLAVLNNPTVVTTRNSLKIAEAQAFSAGLLPDPQISPFYAVPYLGPEPKSTSIGGGISYDFTTLLTFKTQHQSAEAAARQAKLNVLWMEWQAIAQARMLFVQCTANQEMLAVLHHYHANTELAYERVHQSMLEGNNTISNTSAQWLLLQNMNTQMSTLQQQLNQCQHDLRQVLGLSPHQPFQLRSPQPSSLPSQQRIQNALNTLEHQRPDLEALRAGYESQELKLRQAILEQFPAINIQFVDGRDTGQITSYGFNVTMNLPIFNANRGNIAIAKATRQGLYDEYQQRINASDNDVSLIIKQYQLLWKTKENAKQRVATMKHLLDITSKEYQEKNITLLDYVNTQNNILDAELNQITINQQLLNQKIALEAILGNLS